MVLNLKELADLGAQENPKFTPGYRLLNFTASLLYRTGLLPKELDTRKLIEKAVKESHTQAVLADQTDVVKTAATEFKTSPRTPEIYDHVLKVIWEERRRKLAEKGFELQLAMPDFPYSQVEIAVLEKIGRQIGYLPEALSTPEAIRAFNLLWPEMAIDPHYTINNSKQRFGFFDYDSANDAPMQGKNELEMRKIIEDLDRSPMNVNEYCVARQDTKLLNGYYLDQQSSYTRLLDSTHNGTVIDITCSNSRGSSSIHARWAPNYSEIKTGTRTVRYR